MGVAGGNALQSVDFVLNPAMQPGAYSMIVSAAGLGSAPAMVTLSSDLTQISVAPIITSVHDAESRNLSLTPGEWAAVYGLHLADSTRTWNASDFPGA